MLSASQLRAAPRRRRTPPSLKQQYQEYIMQRIEGYKNSIPREQLLRLGDEAVAELQATSDEQFVLTEIVMLESVDRLIMKRLRLRSYRRWREQFIKMRSAQRQPTHWGLDPRCPVSALLPRIESEDLALVVGAGAEPIAYLLAAHDAAVTFIADDLGVVERVESRMSSESLASLFEAYVVSPGPWLPPELADGINLVVIDTGAVAGLAPAAQAAFIDALQERTCPEGVHVLHAGTPALAPEALLPHYAGWRRESPRTRRRGAGRSEGIVLSRLAEEDGENADEA